MVPNLTFVLVGIGDVPMIDDVSARRRQHLRREVPELRLRAVNVTDLLILEKESDHPHGLDAAFLEGAQEFPQGIIKWRKRSKVSGFIQYNADVAAYTNTNKGGRVYTKDKRN
jgi:XFP C-terminal domain